MGVMSALWDAKGKIGSVGERTLGEYDKLALKSGMASAFPRINSVGRAMARHPYRTAGVGYLASKSMSEGRSAAHRSQDNSYIRAVRNRQPSSGLTGLIGSGSTGSWA